MMRTLSLFFLVAAANWLLTACIVVEPTFDKIPPGPYRGVLYLDGRMSERRVPDDIAANYNIDEVQQAELPVNIEVTYAPDSSLRIAFVNGDQRLEATRVEFERLLTSARDSITIHFPSDSYITGYHEEGVIEGEFVDDARETSLRIPFAAFFGIDYRFTDLRKPGSADLAGRWACTFSIEDTAATSGAVAEFTQDGNRLRARFRTSTGDYEDLDGTVQGSRFYLSNFDGRHVRLFAGKVQPDSTLIGIFRSGNFYKTVWTARRDPAAQPPAPAPATDPDRGSAPGSGALGLRRPNLRCGERPYASAEAVGAEAGVALPGRYDATASTTERGLSVASTPPARGAFAKTGLVESGNR